MESCNTESSLDLPLESLPLQPFLQSLHKEQWQEVRLGEVAEINPKETLRKHYLYKKVAMDNLEPYTKKVYSFGIESFNGGAKFRNGDTLLARITPCLENGKTAFVDFLQDDEIAFGSTEFIVLREKATISDKDFLYYLARSKHFREVAIKSMTGSSGRERVQIEVLRDFTFLLPPLTIQQKIAEILSSFDDKIDLLHRQNKTLESLALTLFRHYFIDNPKRDEWELGKLGDYVKIASGKPLEKRFCNENGCYEILGANGAVGKTNKFLCDEKLIYTGRVGTLGKIFLIDYPRKVWLSDNTLIFRTNDSSLYFVYFLLQDLKLENYDVGSTQPLIRQGDLLQIHIRKPNNILILEFNKQAKMYFEKYLTTQNRFRISKQCGICY